MVVRSLERAARFVGAERATVVVLSQDEQWAVRTHQWASEPQFESAQPQTSITGLPWLVEQCRAGQLVFARSLDDLPTEAAAERPAFHAAGFRSLACLPLTTEEHLTGGLAFNWLTREADDVAPALSAFQVPVDVLVVTLDRKRAEAALRESEWRFRALVQNTSDVITMMDADGVVMYATRRSSRCSARIRSGSSERALLITSIPTTVIRSRTLSRKESSGPGAVRPSGTACSGSTARGGTSSPSATTCSTLDITWVRCIDDDTARQALVAGIHHFASLTNCRIIAEGVETEAEADALRRLGIQFGQGFLFGPPVPVDQIASV